LARLPVKLQGEYGSGDFVANKIRQLILFNFQGYVRERKWVLTDDG
jgi:hypothetical protein